LAIVDNRDSLRTGYTWRGGEKETGSGFRWQECISGRVGIFGIFGFFGVVVRILVVGIRINFRIGLDHVAELVNRDHRFGNHFTGLFGGFAFGLGQTLGFLFFLLFQFLAAFLEGEM
jgi:hypothetical protein